MSQAPSQPATKPVEPTFEEIRVAMALNGGVSLAVWMGGCAVELDCARRAHLAPEEVAPPGGEGEARGVYHALCRALRRRLVIDILTGASAGGINGALLGAAMVHRRRLHPDFVRDRWLELGDFSRLLQQTTEPSPRALMQGGLFHDDLVASFESILGDPAASGWQASDLPPGQKDLAPLVPHLEVTMTDIHGRTEIFKDDWGGQLHALEYRSRFKFVEGSQFTVEELAAAARTSASFPVAFEPFKVEGDAADRARVPSGSYGIDGGLLDNAPIRAALEAIPTRRAFTQVSRYLCYLNAEPFVPPADAAGEEPTLEAIIGDVVGLPRKAPFVEQLYAIRDATDESRLTPDIQIPLLTADLPALETTAEALFSAYQQRRTLLSLRELTAEPADAVAASAHLARSAALLPWIPNEVAPGPNADWNWGVAPAKRIVYLLTDLIRRTLDRSTLAEDRAFLLEQRVALDALLGSLEEIGEEVHSSPGIAGTVREIVEDEDVGPKADALSALFEPHAGKLRGIVENASRVFLEAANHPGFELGSLIGPLYGSERISRPTDGSFEHFLRRTLAIEVVRRAFGSQADVDSGQRLRFAQLTPYAPSLIFSATPQTDHGPASPEQKLIGLELGHFAGFYRASWRANDYMWGRLDAAARVVDMLLAGFSLPVIAAEVGVNPDFNPSLVITDGILPEDASEDQRWLVHEAVSDFVGVESGRDPGEIPPTPELRALLAAAIEEELGAHNPDRGVPGLTRAVCVRAAQLEVVGAELGVIAAKTVEDAERGASTPPLELPTGQGMRAAIEDLRTGEPLPRRLADEGEVVSDLALRTGTHAGFVGISAIRTATEVLGRPLSVLRPPLLAVSGKVALAPPFRIVACLGFAASAAYLSGRLATTDKSAPEELSLIWSRPVLVSAIALLFVIGVLLVPAVRVWRGKRRPLNAWWLLGLLSSAVGIAALAMWIGNDLTPTELVFAPGSEHPADWILTATLAVVLGTSLSRVPLIRSAGVALAQLLGASAIGGSIGKTLDHLPAAVSKRLEKWSGGLPSVIFLGLVSLAMLISSEAAVWRHFGDAWWQTATSLAAGALAPVLGVIFFLGPRKVRG